jgi:glycosyltransferase involved in cell wall biosynthesis
VVSLNKKIMLISNTDGALYKFRKSLIKHLHEIGVFTIGIASPFSPEGTYTDRLSDVCDRLYVVDFVRQGWKSFFFTPFKIFNIVRDEKPDIIHIYGHESLIFSILALPASSATIILTITGLGRFFSPQASFFQRLIRLVIVLFYLFALNVVSKIIFLNSSDLNSFSKLFPWCKRKFILINGEGSDFAVSISPNSMKCNESIRFLFASRLMEEKGIFELLQAFRRLPNNYQLEVLGTIDESLRNLPDIISLVSGDIKNVKYYGFVSDITEYLLSSDCVILPTKYMEGLPIILVEALSKGKFIITSNAPGCADTVVADVNGFLLEDVSVEEIYKSALRVSDVNLKMAHDVSTKLFLSRFNSRTVIEEIIKVYDLKNVS